MDIILRKDWTIYHYFVPGLIVTTQLVMKKKTIGN